MVEDEYIRKRRKNGIWAGHSEIMVTGKLYGVNIKVVTSAEGSSSSGFYMHEFDEEEAVDTYLLRSYS